MASVSPVSVSLSVDNACIVRVRNYLLLYRQCLAKLLLVLHEQNVREK